jgi:ABC-type enterobactin transport system permease subunit
MKSSLRTDLGGRKTLQLRHGAGDVSIELRPLLVGLLLLVMSIAVATFSMGVGRIPLDAWTIVQIILGSGPGGSAEQVVLNVRMPRVVTGFFVGAALGASGALFQSVSRNALGSPDIIGFTSGAAAGALAQIVIFGGGPAAVSLSAIAGGLMTALLVYLLSVKDGVSGGYRLVLTGIGVGAVLTALNGLMLVKGDLDDAIAANLWLAGSLDTRKWFHAIPVMIGCLILIPVGVLTARALTMIEMGDDMARQMGVNVEKVRILTIGTAVILASVATGSAGPVAFVALAAPQLARRLTGSANVPVLSGALMGGCLLVCADLISQIAPFNIVIPIGRMTGLVGGIYLAWLLTRARKI